LDILETTESLTIKAYKDMKFLKEKGIQIKYFPNLSFRWLAFNMNDPILGKNKWLRKAISYGIDRDQFINKSTYNSGLKANSILAPGVPGYDPSSSLGFKFDLNHAQALMAKAGYPKGKGLPVFEFSSRHDNQRHISDVKYLQSQLAQLGIKTKLNILNFDDFLKKSRAGELSIWIGGWIFDYPDAENIFQLLYSKNAPGNNKTGFKSAKFDKVYLDLVSLDPGNGRVEELAKTLEKIAMEHVPWIPLYYVRSKVLLKDDIKNYRRASFIRNHLKYLRKF
jgi:oligopeptide transport system substrate-binding protein